MNSSGVRFLKAAPYDPTVSPHRPEFVIQGAVPAAVPGVAMILPVVACNAVGDALRGRFALSQFDRP